MRCKRCWHIKKKDNVVVKWNLSYILCVQQKKKINCKEEEERKKLIIFTYVRSTHVSKPAECVRKNVPSSLSISLSTTTTLLHPHEARVNFSFLSFFQLLFIFMLSRKNENFLIVVVVDEISMMLGLEKKCNNMYTAKDMKWRWW